MRVKTLHFRVVNISRNKASPDNAVKACAYRSGQRLYDDKEEKHHHYGNRKGVLEAEIFAPDTAPDWMKDNDNKQRAWERFGNEIERKEDSHNRRASALLAKDLQVAAPRELNHEQNWQLAKDFAGKINERGLAVAVAFHEEKASDGGKNPHFHFMIAMRDVNEEGFGKRYRNLDSAGKGKENPELMKLRREYYQLANSYLSDAGVKGIYYDPEKQEEKAPGIHLGKNAAKLEEKGVDTEISKKNRRTKFSNFMHQQYGKLQTANNWSTAPNAKKENWHDRLEQMRLMRGSSMASRDALQVSQSNIATPPINRAQKATESAREGAKLAVRQNTSWQERTGRSGSPAESSFTERVKHRENQMEKT